MYDDSWYNFIPDLATRELTPRRGESLLQQPDKSTKPADIVEPLKDVFTTATEPRDDDPPEPTVARRAKSVSDLYHACRDRQSAGPDLSRRGRKKPRSRMWEALAITDSAAATTFPEEGPPNTENDIGPALLRASQQEYLLYQDQLALTERHLGSLISDADAALAILSTLASSFRAVEAQTSSFRARCEDLLTEQQRLERLADAVGTDLHYYAYLDDVTRRLNAPGAGRLVDDAEFSDVLRNLDACITFMSDHPDYRDAESYLARYRALLTRALHLLEVGFNARLEKASAEVSKQIAATKSESARHALAYDRYLEAVLDSHALIPNVHEVCGRVYDGNGARSTAPGVAAPEIYVNTANNLFRAYLVARDADLRPVTQQEVDEFRAQARGGGGGAAATGIETAARRYVKQGFERAFNEGSLFVRIFGLDPLWSQDPESAYGAAKAPALSLVHPANIVPLATHVQAVLQSAGASLESICGVVGSLSHEYLLVDFDQEEEETPFARQCRQFAVRLLAEHLWAFADGAFEAEITKSITRGAVGNDALKIGPVVNGAASSNAYPLTKRALELLAAFDQAMPKERAQKDSPVVFKIVRETIQVLQRAEQKIRSSRKADTDADLFMVKNLLVLKNELVSLEIGDIRTAQPSSSLQHFGQIWDAVRPARWLLPGLFSIGGGIGSGIGSMIGWSSTTAASPTSAYANPSTTAAAAAAAAVTAKTLTVEDMSEQIDELLRQHIYAFTRRYGSLVDEARQRMGGGGAASSGSRAVDDNVERDLDAMLTSAFGGQPEVVARLKEAIEMNVQGEKGASGGRRY